MTMFKDDTILREPIDAAKPVSQRRLAGVVLLGGAVRPTRFHTAVGRSLLDLPYRQGRSLLDEWCDQTAGLPHPYSPGISLRVLTDKATNGNCTLPGDSARQVPVTFDSDPSAWRGTGGVLRDISMAYGADDLLLVANAAQFLLRPLSEITAELADLHADLAVLAHRDGTPTTLMLVRCGCLKTLPEVGFVDMKEQAIPLLTATQDVRAAYVDQPVTLGLRTTQNYLVGLRALHSRGGGVGGQAGNSEAWKSAFSLVEEGGMRADSSTRLHDSVILRGGRVGAGAVLVRSVVCPGGTVPPRAVVVDKLVTSEGQFSAEEGT